MYISLTKGEHCIITFKKKSIRTIGSCKQSVSISAYTAVIILLTNETLIFCSDIAPPVKVKEPASTKPINFEVDSAIVKKVKSNTILQ